MNVQEFQEAVLRAQWAELRKFAKEFRESAGSCELLQAAFNDNFSDKWEAYYETGLAGLLDEMADVEQAAADMREEQLEQLDPGE